MPPNVEQAELEYLKGFEESHPNIKVEMLNFPGARYDLKMPALVAGGAAPDVFGPHARADFMVKGVFLELSDRLKSDRDVEVEDFFPIALEYYAHDNYFRGRGPHQVGLPYVSGSNVTYYNKTAFEKAGVPNPQQALDNNEWTYDKLLELAKSLTTQSGGRVEQFGLDWGGDVPSGMCPHTWAHGGDLMSEDGFTSTWNTKEVIDTLKWIQDLRFTHKVSPTPADAQANIAFQTGRVAMATSSSSLVATLKRDVKDWEWDVVPLPSGPNGTFHRFYSLGLGVHAKGSQIDESWELLKYYTGKEVQSQRQQELGILTTRKSVAEGPAYEAFRPPEHAVVFVDAALAAKLWLESSATGELYVFQMQQFDLIRTNQAKPEDVVTKVDEFTQPLLDKVKAGTYAVPESQSN